MAGIDDKIAALAFTVTTSRTHERIAELVGDAAQIARSTGPKVSVSENSEGGFDGVIKNFAGVTLAEFTVRVETGGDGSNVVMFQVDDVFRTREMLFYVIPISPWGAPGYKTLRAFSEYLREKVQGDTVRICGVSRPHACLATGEGTGNAGVSGRSDVGRCAGAL
ncbi:hypothetical protein JOD52_002898 [Brachybacterium muris]|uniref:hypothetical protein n=1 Tax=Brachybacterium muris TaxID=219301 RepID=UPI00195A372F|nr:hypothetical protein [Brachybacterium muris]MBM7502058.1 hypothetical protein [Brachybacterium muris]